ncbi:class F sortase [Streptomyces sp. JNUCC 64]
MTTATGRLATVTAWAVLLSGAWLWGREITSVPTTGPAGPVRGDVAAVGRPLGGGLPAPHRPLAPARPERVDVPLAGVRAPVVARGLDRTGAVEAPPLDQPGTVAWYGTGPAPGSAGAALLVGHADGRSAPAVFHRLRTLVPGDEVRVYRADGTAAGFTVEDVRMVERDRFDAARVYGPDRPGRAELRLITCGGTFDRASGTYSANVVVSAYLTDARRG